METNLSKQWCYLNWSEIKNNDNKFLKYNASNNKIAKCRGLNYTKTDNSFNSAK